MTSNKDAMAFEGTIMKSFTERLAAKDLGDKKPPTRDERIQEWLAKIDGRVSHTIHSSLGYEDLY